MKSKHVSVILVLVLVAILGTKFWVSGRGYSSATFAGSSFHAESAADCMKVYSEFEDFLTLAGFSRTSSPSELDSWAGVHSEEGQRVWFSRPAGRGEQLYLYVDLDATHIRTSIKWEYHGFKKGAAAAQREALRFALEVDGWMGTIPEYNELPERFRVEKRQGLVARIAQLQEG
ncbi:MULTISPECIES: hypothetical protein [unclassified Lentimonas]|uniref:hypothetical protein n=1 Tax=unclassified Lentimonas TaxID=2630993 RepID=UPI00132C15B0|nr:MULTISPECIES: hypothetical protein [unclassified Lentimonas]CAA6678836.1 Unannotated [Lentimonas sp. CC4]CAA6684440.1 Unannotated [Lentimonas sp. CC6]CAA7077481.1 Unannotated [Lentimonas sp. CC4]CAA7171315.1 Unannotated [Lentimonas sp. CC21]CAA7183345.1 Unannotated [Lentimonas sp. CC8]